MLIQQRGELFHAKGRQDGEKVDFVREVEVEDLVRWEGRLHAIECDWKRSARHCRFDAASDRLTIDRANRLGDEMVVDPRQNLSNVADTVCSSCWRLEAECASEVLHSTFRRSALLRVNGSVTQLKL